MASAVVKSGTKDPSKSAGKGSGMTAISENNQSGVSTANPSHALVDSWTFWYRPPISKAHGFIEYEKTLHEIATSSGRSIVT
ncbi:hypothetical protein LB505_010288 [Fusarium chuoi]|nr:hypothetical protein LB505_010288 [Fusarium chuoi]